MEKFKIKEGFTKAGIIAAIVMRNNGERCVDPVPYFSNSFACLYRGPNNNVCFAGALIPDSEYVKEMEGSIISDRMRMFPRLEKHMPLCPEGMDALQAVHDQYDSYVKKAAPWYWPFKDSLHDRLINFVNERLEY